MSFNAYCFNDLLRALAEEHATQLEKVLEENDSLKRQLDAKMSENIELHERLSGGAHNPTGWARSTTAARVLASIEGSAAGVHHALTHEAPCATASGATGDGATPKHPRRILIPAFRFSAASSPSTTTPPHDGYSGCRYRLRQLLHTTQVEFVVALFVTASALTSALELQYNGLNSGIEEPIVLPWVERWFKVAEMVFTFVFTIELCLRLFAFRLEFFCVFLNWPDFVAVVVALIDLIASDEGSGPGALRLMRLVKLSRALRLVRMLSFLESLLFLLQCMRASLPTLFWSICVLLVIQCIIGMFISHLVQDYIRGGELFVDDIQKRRAVYMYYGTFTRTIITMFEIHLANWSPACRVLVDNVGEWLGYLFLLYRCLAGFAVLNVINAVFIQQTMKVAQQDLEVKIAEREKNRKRSQRELEDFFSELDDNNDGQLSKEEFNALLTNKKLQAWLSCLEIELSDAIALFETMRTGSQQIKASEFVSRLSTIKGPARASDMTTLLTASGRIETRLNKLEVKLNALSILCQSTPWLVTEDELAPNSLELR